MPDLDRFRTARSTLLVDRFMGWFIRIGGLAIIAAVFAIFFFILAEILPLFRSARVEAAGDRPGPAAAALAFGVDEWGELPFVLTADGTLSFLPASGPALTSRIALREGERITAACYDQKRQFISAGTSAGRVLQVELRYANAQAQVSATPDTVAELTLGIPGRMIVGIGFGESAEAKLLAIVQEADGIRTLHASAFTVARAKMGAKTGAVEKLWEKDLTTLLAEPVQHLLVDERAETIIASDRGGRVTVLGADTTGVSVFQEPFRPFADLPDPAISSLNYLFGDVSLVLTAASGENRIFSLYIHGGAQKRQYGLTKELPPLSAGATAYASSVRNKAFLLADGNEVSLRFATSATVRWQGTVANPVRDVILSGKYDRVFTRDDRGAVHAFRLDDPHPEAGAKAFFGKVWYEGGDRPEYSWQSSGTDDSEPKLSLIPLLFGTLKGTLYAMLFAVPIAVLAALYTAEFMRPAFKVWVKPTIEVMASLPSVVLGFLAALWLAPLIDERVPAILCCVLALPAAAMLFGWGWTRLPDRMRSRIRPGWEFLAFLPVMLAVLVVAWNLGRPVEQLLFDGDFRTWWPKATGTAFEQRNSLVVGFMMGFAVIPILFTIIEDALANVPANLRSGSLALGASRWQTAIRVVLPTASAGVLSALMIGLGRAVGETMIMVMATGNTPVTDWNLFNGMRTLAANIAVELPEAPHGGTLYRTLFLCAMLLFLLTFVINTLAEILRQHLREKYKTV